MELDDLYQEIHNLTEQIHNLEEAVAILIYTVMFQAIYGGDALVQSLSKDILINNAEKFIHIPLNSQKVIEEFGGDRNFIERFLNPSKKENA